MSGIDPLPDAPSRSDPENFAADADAFLAAMVTMVLQMNALAAAMGVAIDTGNFRVSAAGEVTMVSQPSFLGTMVSNLDVTGGGGAVTVFTNTEVRDQSGDFVHTTTVFTAPIAGTYWFWLSGTLQGLTASHTSAELTLVTSNRNYPVHGGNYGAMRSTSNNELPLSAGFVGADMDAGDTASFQLTISGGTVVVDLSNMRMAGGLLH